MHCIISQNLDDSNFSFLRSSGSLLLFLKCYFLGNPDDEDSSDSLQKKDFNFLSKRIGPDWKRFARQFNIEDNKVSDITNKSSRCQDRCYDVFNELSAHYGSVKWKLVNGFGRT